MSTTSDPGTSVLVVEDDPLLRGALRMVLEWEGYRVACAADGREALNRLRGGERPSVILLDVAMPVLDGRQFRQEQGRDPNLALIPVVVISGVETAASVDAAAHVQKPFAPGQLLEALQHVRRPEPPLEDCAVAEREPVTAYREAFRALEETEDRAKVLLEPIIQLANAVRAPTRLEHVLRSAFPPLPPDAEVRQALIAWCEARARLLAAWRAIPAEDRDGLPPPPARPAL